VLAALALVVGPTATSSANAGHGAVITNGTVMLGVNDTGDLNYDCTAQPGCPAQSLGEHVSVVGIRYVPLNTDAIAPGCLCEGWGVADAGSGLVGFSDEDQTDTNVTVDSFTSTAATAVSTVSVADASKPGYKLQVVQDYHPSPDSANLYEVGVTITNTGTSAVSDLRYRRLMDWDIEPTAFEEWVTIQGTNPQLRFDSDDGFADASPLAAPSYLQSETVCGSAYTGPCAFTDLGDGGVFPTVTEPYDHGALFDFGFGALDPGKSVHFTVAYGATDSEAHANDVIKATGLEVYSLGEPNCPSGSIPVCSSLPANAGVSLGEPNTYIFGFVTTQADISLTGGVAPEPVQQGQPVAYTLTVQNSGPNSASAVHVTDPIPPGLTLVDATPSVGTCTPGATLDCNLGNMTSGASATITIHATASGTGTVTNTFTAKAASADPNPANNTLALNSTINRAPVAVNDSVTRDPTKAVPIKVLANDSDPDGDPITVKGHSSPKHGTVNCTAAGSCTYKPKLGFSSADSFTYTISDGRGGTATASVSLKLAVSTSHAPVVSPGPTDTTLQPGPKGTFRIVVIYQVRNPCLNPCSAHALIRTRSGRRVYAESVGMLKGDGPVLGTRGKFKLPVGPKIKFVITISKAALLKAHFVTQGGFRITQTRMSVWLNEGKGKTLLTLRDGHIKVSIARIKSGKLPGLKGVL
jgi:uncharacterized repeat protein (TIGR01451 family)